MDVNEAMAYAKRVEETTYPNDFCDEEAAILVLSAEVERLRAECTRLREYLTQTSGDVWDKLW